MGDKEIRTLCYADNAVLIAENKDDLQRLLYHFNTTAQKFKVAISAAKTKCVTASNCKLEIDNKIVQQEMKFNYLDIEYV